VHVSGRRLDGDVIGGDITLYFRPHCVDIRLFETMNAFVDISTVRG